MDANVHVNLFNKKVIYILEYTVKPALVTTSIKQ
jgi:hypothetical protein